MMDVSSQVGSGIFLTALFAGQEQAERAYQAATERGYTQDDINVVMSDATRTKQFTHSRTTETRTETGSGLAAGAEVGGAVGATVGAILGAIAAAGTSIALPGLGLVVAGPIAAALGGAGAGALAGGALGAMGASWGMPPEQVKHYESGIQQGAMLIGVRVRSQADADAIEQQWRGLGGQHVFRSGAIAATRPQGADDTADYRSHWQSAYGATGGQYEDYDAAYRFGSTMADSGRFQSYRWNDVEPQLRSDWEASHPGGAWDKVKEAVRFGAQRASGKH